MRSWTEVGEEYSPQRIRPWAEIVGTSRPEAPRNTGPRPSSNRPQPRIWVAEIRGERVALVRIAEVALALNRRPRTIRQWESLGTLPPAPYWSLSSDHRGVRRLYSPAHVDGIVRIAVEEGILYGKPPNLSKTQFPQRVRRLYDQLAAEAAQPLPPGRQSG